MNHNSFILGIFVGAALFAVVYLAISYYPYGHFKKPKGITYIDPAQAPDGPYIVTFDNGCEELMLVKDGVLWGYEVLARDQLTRIKGHKPVKLTLIKP